VTSICGSVRRFFAVVKCIDELSASSIQSGIKHIISQLTANHVMLFSDDTALNSKNYAVLIYILGVDKLQSSLTL
jgi:hypothetical protein